MTLQSLRPADPRRNRPVSSAYLLSNAGSLQSGRQPVRPTSRSGTGSSIFKPSAGSRRGKIQAALLAISANRGRYRPVTIAGFAPTTQKSFGRFHVQFARLGRKTGKNRRVARPRDSSGRWVGIASGWAAAPGGRRHPPPGRLPCSFQAALASPNSRPDRSVAVPSRVSQACRAPALENTRSGKYGLSGRFLFPSFPRTRHVWTLRPILETEGHSFLPRPYSALAPSVRQP